MTALLFFVSIAAVSFAAAARAVDYRGAPAPPAFGPAPGEVLVFSDDFNALNFSVWKHEITLTGGGNCALAVVDKGAPSALPRDLAPTQPLPRRSARRLAPPRLARRRVQGSLRRT